MGQLLLQSVLLVAHHLRLLTQLHQINRDLWPAFLKPDNHNIGDEWVEEDGRDWKDHGAHGVQNSNPDGYTSVASRIAATAGWDTEAVISWGEMSRSDTAFLNIHPIALFITT